MRWNQLFADLEARLDALATGSDDAEVAERSRIEAGRLTFHARLLGALGRSVSLRCAGAGDCAGRLDTVGTDWVLLADGGSDRETLVPLGSVLAAGGLGRHSDVAPAYRYGIRVALRGIARDRAPIRLVLGDATPIDGTLDRVGADHVEVAEHALGEPRRPGSVTAVRTVPLAGIGVVRRW